MRRPRGLLLVVLLGLLACDSDGLTPGLDASLSIVVEQEAGFTSAADAGVVHIVGPSSRTVNIQPGETRTITGLSPGPYVVTLEALLGGRLEAIGATTVTVVAGENRQANITLRSFVPNFLNVPAEAVQGVPFTIQFGSVTGATSYLVEWDDQQSFPDPTSLQVPNNTAQINIGTPGQNFVRVSARSEFGTQGVPTAPETVQVIQALSITTESLPDATVGTGYSETLEAVGGDGSYAWSLIAGSLPPGLTLSAAGTISGTPTTAGEFTFTVEVTSVGMSAERELTIVVQAEALSITTGSLPDATLDQPYNQALEATGGDGTYAWGIVAGNLPPDLALSTGGTISGTPTTAGEFTFTVEVTSAGLSAQRELTLRVRAVPLAYAYVRHAEMASYTPEAIDYENFAGGSIRITRTGEGAYTVDFDDLHTVGTSFAAFVNAVSPARNTDLVQGGPVCRLRGLAGGGPASPIQAFVACEDPTTGNAADSQYRIMVVGNDVLGQSGPAGPQAGFSLHNDVGATAGYTPLAERSWNSLGNPQLVTPQGSGIIRHDLGLDVPVPFTVAVTPLGGAAGTGADTCRLQEGAGTFVNIHCTSRPGASVDRAHFVLQLAEGRPAAPWAYAFVRAPDGAVSALSAASEGTITAVQQGPGQWTLGFGGLNLPATPAIVVTPVQGTDDPWTHCSHFRTGNAPLTVDVACSDASGAFVQTAFTILVLR